VCSDRKNWLDHIGGVLAPSVRVLGVGVCGPLGPWTISGGTCGCGLTRDPPFSVAVWVSEEFSLNIRCEPADHVGGIVCVIGSTGNLQCVLSGPQDPGLVKAESSGVTGTVSDDAIGRRVVVDGEGRGQRKINYFCAGKVGVDVAARADVYVYVRALKFQSASVVGSSSWHVDHDELHIAECVSAVVVPPVDSRVAGGVYIVLVVSNCVIEPLLVAQNSSLSVSVGVFEDSPDVAVAGVYRDEIAIRCGVYASRSLET